MNHQDLGSGRYLIRLDPGEEVVASLVAFAERHRVTAGWVTGIGSLDQAILGFLDPKESVYLKRTFDERLEIGSLTGNIGLSEGQPFAHVHTVLAPRELLAYTGHLHEGRVGVVVELLVHRLEGVLERRVDPATGFARLVLPGDPPPPQAS
jgi:hypothetical protein